MTMPKVQGRDSPCAPRRHGWSEKAEKDGDIGQDESRGQSEKVQKMTDDTISEIDRLLAEKEKEIMQV